MGSQSKMILSVSACIVLITSILIGNVNASVLEAIIGSRAAGMGTAVIANPDNIISAFYYNIAGLADVKGNNLELGAAYANYNLRYKNFRGYDKQNVLPAFAPNFSYSTDYATPVVLGVSSSSSLGVGFEFKKDPAHGITSDIKSTAGILSLSPGIAYKLTPKLNVGLLLSLGYGITKTKTPDPVFSGNVIKVETDGIGFGTSIGMVYKYSELLNLGLSWRSPMHVSQGGDARIGGNKYDCDIDIYSPQMLAAGIGYNITPKFLLAGFIKWADWSYFDRSKTKINNVEQPFAKNTRDGIRYGVGCEYIVNDLLTLRSGFLYDEYSIQKEWISPSLSDATTYTLTTGSTFTIDQFKIDLFLSVSGINSRNVTNSQTGYPGKYEGYSFPFAGIDVTYVF